MPTYNNKVVLRNGTVVLDVTPTTAVESDVASGKIFVKADGSLGTGTASGGGGDNVFLVTLSWDDDFLPEDAEEPGAWVPDQTWAEIKAAGDAGKEITVTASDASPATGYYFSESEPPNELTYTVISYNGDKVLENRYSISGTGIALLGEDVAIYPNFVSPSRTYTPSDQVQTETITYVPDYYNGIEEVNVTVNAIPSNYVGSGVTRRSSSDLSASGGTVSVPAGYYESAASKAVSSGSEGTPTASKGSVSNHSVTVTPSVTNTAGFISGGTKTGTGVSVTVAELESGTKSITENGTGISVSGYSAVDVNVSATETVFVVTLSWDSQENMYMPDCTYAQAYAAYQAGKTIAFECGEDDGYAPYFGLYSEDDSCFVYGVLKSFDSSSPSYHWGYQTYVYLWSNEGIELDDDQIIYSMDAATATAAEIASGSYAFISSGLVTGTATRRDSTSLSASGATVSVPAGYYENAASKSVASGTAGTPTATKGTVSNHSVTVTPTVTNTAGYISGGTKTGTGVSVAASELVSGSETKTANGTYNVTNLAELVVNVSGGSSKALYKYDGLVSRMANSYGATSAKVTVTKAGTYNISYVAIRGSSSGTMGTNLHIGSTEGTNQQTWNNGTYGQYVHLTNQQISANTDVTIYATSGSNSRRIYVGMLIVEEV